LTIAKLLFVFVVMVALLIRRLNLGVVMVGASCFLGLLFGLSPADFLEVFLRTVTSRSNLYLLLALSMIMIMEAVLQREGSLRRMVNALQSLVGNPRAATAALPALVGLIPSVGGAIFSAPMIKEMTEGSKATAERKSFINYWYRHIWEYASPIYPTVLLAIQIFEKSVANVIPYLLPTIPIAIFTGWTVAFGGLRLLPPDSRECGSHHPFRDLASGLLPILFILLLVLLLQIETAIAVAAVVVGLLIWHRLGPTQWLPLLRKAISLNILFSMTAVLLFKEMLIASQAVADLAPVLAASPIPPIALFIILPLLVGMATGAAQASVGTAAPILVGLMGGSEAVSPALVAVMIVSGCGGVMLSPLHMCLVLTVSYFQANLARVYRMMIVPELTFLGISLTYLAFL